MSIHLRVMPLAVSVATASEMGRIASLHFAAMPLGKNIARLISFRVQHDVAILVSSNVHRLSFLARAVWNRSGVLQIGQSVRRLVTAVNSLSLALSVFGSWLRSEGGISKLLPAVVVHRAPASAKPLTVAPFKDAGKPGLKTLGSFALRRVGVAVVDISVELPTTVVHYAQSVGARRFFAFIDRAGFHSGNIQEFKRGVNKQFAFL